MDDRPHRLLSGVPRRGKWTPEEETYAAAIIQHFLSGVLPVQYGTTLRGFIAQLLHCDPMRVSKKLIPGSVLVGVRIDPKIGRRPYYPCGEYTPGLGEHRETAMRHLAQLRAAFIESIEREEQQELAASARAMPLQGDRLHYAPRTPRVELPLSMCVRPVANDAACRDSLPSLSDLLRQKRLRIPSKTLSPRTTPVMPPPLSYQYLHPTHGSVFHYASPPRSSATPTSPP